MTEPTESISLKLADTWTMSASKDQALIVATKNEVLLLYGALAALGRSDRLAVNMMHQLEQWSEILERSK